MLSIPSKHPPKRVLVWAVPGLGDVLLATPLVRSIKSAYPNAAIDVVVQGGGGAMLVGNADVRRTISIPKRPNPFQFLKLIARVIGRYQLAITAMGGDRPVFVTRLASPRCVATLHPTDITELWSRCVVTRWVPRDADRQQVLRHMELADAIGVERKYAVVPPMDAAAPARLDERVPFDWRTEPYAVLHPSTNATRKRWTLDGWEKLGRSIVDRGWKCVITGGPNEAPGYIEGIVESIGTGAMSLAGQLALTDVRALIERCRLYVGVDTSATHIAAAVGAPTVGLFGPGPTNRFAPYPKGYASNDPPFWQVIGAATNGNVCLIQAECPCAHKYREGCGTEMPGRSRCLEGLGTDYVIQAIESFLATNPAVA